MFPYERNILDLDVKPQTKTNKQTNNTLGDSQNLKSRDGKHGGAVEQIESDVLHRIGLYYIQTRNISLG